VAIALLATVILSGCVAWSIENDASARLGGGREWPTVGGGTDETSYSRLEALDTGNVTELGLAWSLDLEGEQMLEATPLAVDDRLYFTGTFGKVYAVDARTGSISWTHDPEVWKVAPDKFRYNLVANRGVAYAGGQIFSVTFDGRLQALDAASGSLLWSEQTLDPASVQTATGAPRTFRGKVIIGNGGGDFGSRGYVTAYDQKTGKRLWRFYTAPGSPEQNKGDPAMEAAARTWDGEYWKTGTGGTVWNGISFDSELNRIYIGTGNSGPYDPAVRSPGDGDNLYLVSIVALDADTGKYSWHYQMNPREAWDYKATANMILANLEIGGRQRKVIMQAPTNGFFYVIDRETGQLISAEKIGKVTWAERIDIESGRPVEAPNIRYESGESVIWPSSLGAHNWQPMAFSPDTGLVYIPYMQLGLRYTRVQALPGEKTMGGLALQAVLDDQHDGKGALVAWDPVAQKPRWTVWHDWIWNGGILATSGNLVFQGTADGFLSGYDAETGRRLWRFNVGLGIISAPITYEIDGRQYVSVLAGYGAPNVLGGDMMNVGWKYGAQPRRLLTFALRANGRLQTTAPASTEINPLDDPKLVISEEYVAEGGRLFATKCMVCHGLGAVSAGAPAPDLRESPVALKLDSFDVVVRKGTLLRNGMPRFEELDDLQLRHIHVFIRAKAREAVQAGPRQPEVFR